MKDEKRGQSSIFWLLLMIVLLLIIAFGIMLLSKSKDDKKEVNNVAVDAFSSAYEETSSTDEALQTETTDIQIRETNTDNFKINDNELYSKAVYLMNADGEELYSKNSEEQIYPASLTKIMTAIIAIENINDFNESVVIPGDIFEYIEEEEASTAGFKAYESVTYKDLLYGTLLSSGAECCLTLASYIAGSEEMFVQMMNEKAAELGMEHTNFTNTSGLHSYDHYSTAEDIAKLLTYALENDEFREIFTCPSYYTETDYNPSGITLSSTMFSELDSKEFNGGVFLGGKTGFTNEAGLCLASLSRINGKEYILVTTGADGTHYTEPFHIYDAVTVYESIAGTHQTEETIYDDYQSEEHQNNDYQSGDDQGAVYQSD